MSPPRLCPPGLVRIVIILAVTNAGLARFRASASGDQQATFASFYEELAFWIEDFALYAALKATHGFRPWRDWEPELVARRPEALAAWREALAERIESHRFW